MSEQMSMTPERAVSVRIGRQGYASVLLRLIGMELYKIRRRAMSKVLSSIAIVAILGIFLLISLGTVFVVNSPASTFAPPGCSATNNSPGCTNQELSQTALAQAKQRTLRGVSDPLRLPTSLNVSELAIQYIGLILIIILIGTIVGGEYGQGTVRLMFTRGPTRTQFLLAKIGTAIVCIALPLLILIPLGILTGFFLNLLSGITPSFDFFSAVWLGHALLLVLLSMLGLFIYAMMALFLGTLGRSTVAGVAGALIWALVELIVGGILTLIGSLVKGPLGNTLTAIPDYFVSSNISALVQNQGLYVFSASASSLSDLHALLVLACYLAVFIGLAWWVSVRRDVTT